MVGMFRNTRWSILVLSTDGEFYVNITLPYHFEYYVTYHGDCVSRSRIEGQRLTCMETRGINHDPSGFALSTFRERRSPDPGGRQERITLEEDWPLG